jgi:hypothetical protein
LARETARHEGWLWKEPVKVYRRKAWVLLGPATWEVYSNAGQRGSNVHVTVDDRTATVVHKTYAPSKPGGKR